MRALLRVGIVVLFVAGVGLFFLRQTAASVDVLIWTSGEKQNVLAPALERFNESGQTVTVGGARYAVRAHSVTVNSGEMYDHLVRKLTRGVEFPSSTQGAPTVVSPSTSDWLAQVNLEAGRQVFDTGQLKSIVRYSSRHLHVPRDGRVSRLAAAAYWLVGHRRAGRTTFGVGRLPHRPRRVGTQTARRVHRSSHQLHGAVDSAATEHRGRRQAGRTIHGPM